MLGELILLALQILGVVVNLIMIVVIIHVLIGWLVSFEIVSARNEAISTIWGFTRRVVEPMLAPIRRFVPIIGGLDLSPLILILALSFLVPLLSILLSPIIRGPL
jgi:YggT family protein